MPKKKYKKCEFAKTEPYARDCPHAHFTSRCPRCLWSDNDGPCPRYSKEAKT